MGDDVRKPLPMPDLAPDAVFDPTHPKDVSGSVFDPDSTEPPPTFESGDNGPEGKGGS